MQTYVIRNAFVTLSCNREGQTPIMIGTSASMIEVADSNYPRFKMPLLEMQTYILLITFIG